MTRRGGTTVFCAFPIFPRVDEDPELQRESVRVLELLGLVADPFFGLTKGQRQALLHALDESQGD